VTLKAGQSWRYQSPQGHAVLWIAIGKGVVTTPQAIDHGEIAVFEPGTETVEFVAQSDAEFFLGSAVPHNHDLVLGYYSVHTSPEALQKGEAQIEAIRHRLIDEGRL
jgi:redox-sensitive bicupin YhaK (pirin superfamily)